MATGVGKTFTAIGCIKKLQSLNKKLLVVIAAPYTNLVDQWEEELKKWFIPSIKLEKGWTLELRQEIKAINKSDEDELTVFVCSHAICLKKFMIIPWTWSIMPKMESHLLR